MKTNELGINKVDEEVRQAGLEVPVYFKNGFLEKLGEDLLAYRLIVCGTPMNFGAAKYQVQKLIL